MEKIGSRQFQLSYQRLTEPVIVTARWRTLGTWYPAGTEPGRKASDGPTGGTKVRPSSPAREKSRQPGFGHSSPAPK